MGEGVLVVLFITSILVFIITLYVVVPSILPNKKRKIDEENAALKKEL